ncbi:hypothetical protein JZ751_000744 [Albula glossodonta]|uniref:Amphiphysin n=1 Tax=Albula glossodonta TaxID=121402 RepID=A0A8T2PX18_9TELE|nr:hypothetical protein JZ751_000744 [Albula glossodonta]
MQQASMNLTESLHEVYEPDWYGKDDVMTVGKKLVDSSLITLDTYLAQFPDIKNRVSKRSRKLIDYDSARHHLETLQASTMRNERKVAKAEEEFNKAQKVFDELNVDLQEELPTLWDSRVGFYVNTFKNVTHLESKFHREISGLCHKLYEVMNKLGDQHSDKMFTIQGAPSDSGPLRFARTPTPPDDESPPESPEASPNHMLAPGPHRPKSPNQLKRGPPVPPPPKVTPTKELHQEQIISLFDDNFAPNAGVTPAPPGEKTMDSLLDLDFDPFKPDATTPIAQSQSPMSQTLPWDLWTAPAVETAQPGASDWAADFSSPAATAGENGDQGEAAAPAADEGQFPAVQEEGQAWPPADAWGAEATQAQEETAGAEVRGWDTDQSHHPNPDSDPFGAGGGEVEPKLEGNEQSWGEEGGEAEDQSMPGIIFTNEYGQEIQDTTEGSEPGLYSTQGSGDGSKLDWGLPGQAGSDWSGSEYETADEWADGAGQNGGWVSAEEEAVAVESIGVTVQEAAEQPGVQGGVEEQGGFADWGTTGDKTDPFQTQAEGENAGFPNEPADGAWFQEAGPTAPVTKQADADPFGGADAFATSQADPFAQASASEPVLDFVSDPFAEPLVGEGAGWAADPFASESNQMWPDNWAPAAAGDNWAFPSAPEGEQSNGLAQWAAFPEQAADGEGSVGAGSGSPWQEVSGSSGFFSSDGQGDFATGWGDGDQDPFSSLPSATGEKEVGGPVKAQPAPPGPQGSRMSTVEAAPVHKDTENNNSDLSEDEVANRRYGKLYQEVDTEKEEDISEAEVPETAVSPEAEPPEGDDDRDGDITSPTASSVNDMTPESQTGPPGMPAGFLYKVETMHDFEAANSDELDLKKGDMVLVIPTELAEDQDAGWLTGIKESDWLQLGVTANKGLFPENFTQRLD